MLERDMEDLIAAHPKDFFNKVFTLIGRQQSFADVGRFDLLFQDEFGWMILVELKALRAIGPVEVAPLINYLRVARRRRGLLLNFGTTSLQHKRIVVDVPGGPSVDA